MLMSDYQALTEEMVDKPGHRIEAPIMVGEYEATVCWPEPFVFVGSR